MTLLTQLMNLNPWTYTIAYIIYGLVVIAAYAIAVKIIERM